MYAHRCDRCGAYLDPGEHCDCEREEKRERELREQQLEGMVVPGRNGQLVLAFGKEATA